MRQWRLLSVGSWRVIAVSIVVCIFAVAAGVGLFIHIHHSPVDKPSTAADNSPATTATPALKHNPNPQPYTTTYLDIKEWGIKIPLSASIQDAYYTTEGSNTGSGTANTAWLGLTSLNSSGCNVAGIGPTTNAKPVGSILRVIPTDTDPIGEILYTQEYPNGVTINGYYYAYKPWANATCASQATLESIDSAFGVAVENAANNPAATVFNFVDTSGWASRSPIDNAFTVKFGAYWLTGQCSDNHDILLLGIITGSNDYECGSLKDVVTTHTSGSGITESISLTTHIAIGPNETLWDRGGASPTSVILPQGEEANRYEYINDLNGAAYQTIEYDTSYGGKSYTAVMHWDAGQGPGSISTDYFDTVVQKTWTFN